MFLLSSTQTWSSLVAVVVKVSWMTVQSACIVSDYANDISAYHKRLCKLYRTVYRMLRAHSEHIGSSMPPPDIRHLQAIEDLIIYNSYDMILKMILKECVSWLETESFEIVCNLWFEVEWTKVPYVPEKADPTLPPPKKILPNVLFKSVL